MVVLQRSASSPGDPAAMWPAVFPGFVWREVLASPTVSVSVRIVEGGSARLLAAADGTTTVLATSHHDGEWSCQADLTDHTWLWVDGDVAEVVWECSEDTALPRVTAVVPTFGRPREAVTQTRSLLAAEVVARVLVIDQAGTLAIEPDFAALHREAGERIILLTQDNLGGSGGYARGMLESLRWPDDAVFLSDDDATIDPESLRRMLVLQTLSRARGRSCIVGTGMRSAERPASLVSLAERVDPRRFWWEPADGVAEPLDLAAAWPDEYDKLVPTRPTDYAGWWGALLPPGTVSEIGLPAPYFLKWDDAEYGLRARRRGYLVRTPPGVAVTHPTWAAKRTAAGWASLLMHRNRIATAAAYGAGRGVVLDSLIHQVKHILSLQYTTASLWQQATRTVLAGPAAWLGSDLRQARDDAQRHVDAQPKPGVQSTDREATALRRPPLPLALARAISGLWSRPHSSGSRTTSLLGTRFRWRDGLGADRVVLKADTGEPDQILQRDPRLARALLLDAVRTHVRLGLNWSRLSDDYRRMLPSVVTADYWHRTIGPEPPVGG